MNNDTNCACTDTTCPVHPGMVCTNDAKNKIGDVPFCDGCLSHSFGETERAG